MHYTITDAAKKIGVTAHTLRYYDKEGLLPFIHRTSSGIRAFEENDMDWLQIIACLKRTGMPVKDIKTYIDLCMEGEGTLEHRLLIFKQHQQHLAAKMAEMQGFMETLEFKIHKYETALTKERSPFKC